MSPHDHHLTRRQSMGALGVAGAGLLLGRAAAGEAPAEAVAAAASCTLTPAQEEGPFYVDLERVRSTIVGTRKGVPLDLRIAIVDSGTCAPIAGAAVDIWHADAVGAYSDESSQETSGQTWLRGVQLTGDDGVARFKTIYPGFYSGRAPHIHLKVHVGGKRNGTTYSGGHVSHTGQLFLPEAISTAVYRRAPYTSDPNQRTPRASDRVYTQQHGASAVLKVTRLGSLAGKGVRGTVTLGVDPAALQ
jgi:protocatechuate 3,4-dioxygenase beta subunit